VDNFDDPDETSPSICLLSLLSAASEYSFDKVPVSATKIANTPERGPKPNALTKIKAQIRISTPRIKSRNLLIINLNKFIFITCLDARSPKGMDITEAAIVPRKAIAKVCKIPTKIELKFHDRKSFQVIIESNIGFILFKPLIKSVIEILKYLIEKIRYKKINKETMIFIGERFHNGENIFG
jgi:hypothetical protein